MSGFAGRSPAVRPFVSFTNGDADAIPHVAPVSVFAAIVLLAVDVGAFVTQIAVLHGDWIHTVVIGAILGAVIYLQRHHFGSRG